MASEESERGKAKAFRDVANEQERGKGNPKPETRIPKQIQKAERARNPNTRILALF
jgi:hypothetical protein